MTKIDNNHLEQPIEVAEETTTSKRSNKVKNNVIKDTDMLYQASEKANQIFKGIKLKEDLSIYDLSTIPVDKDIYIINIIAKHYLHDKFVIVDDISKTPVLKCSDGNIWVYDTSREYLDADNWIINLIDDSLKKINEKSIDLCDNKYMQEAIDEYRKSLSKKKHSLIAKKNYDRIIRRAMYGKNGCSVSESIFDKDINTLTTPNGIIDLRTGDIRDTLPTDYRRRHTSCDLLPEAYQKAPEIWLKTLRECLYPVVKEAFPSASDEQLEEHFTQLIGFIQRLLGYCLIGSNPEQKFIIFVGHKGRNGKGVICHVLREILNDYACEVRSEMFMKGRQKSSGDATSDIMATEGKRLMIGSENDRGDSLNATFLKRITGGDKLSGRALYQNEREFMPTAVPIILTNFFPYFDSEDTALLRRCICIPFMRTFKENPDPNNFYEGEIDYNLEDKLRDEYQYILSWLVDGAVYYSNEGRLKIPEYINRYTNEYRKSKDTLGAFIDECCKVSDKYKISSSNLYAAYAQWAHEAGNTTYSRQVFKDRMTSKGFRYQKSNTMVIHGLTLNDDAEIWDLIDFYNNRKRPGSDRSTPGTALTKHVRGLDKEGKDKIQDDHSFQL